MTDGLLLWGSVASIQDIFILQKRAVRAIYEYNLRSRESLKVFKEINIYTVASQYIYENIMYTRKHYDSFTKKVVFIILTQEIKINLPFQASDFRKPEDYFWYLGDRSPYQMFQTRVLPCEVYHAIPTQQGAYIMEVILPCFTGSKITRLREARRIQRMQRSSSPSSSDESNHPPCPPTVDKVAQKLVILELAKKTITLMQKNQLIQQKIVALQKETSEFVAAVMKNPENRRRYYEHLMLYGIPQRFQLQITTENMSTIKVEPTT
ncbi:unnamed protein product [Diatraea saccharalis]|uniref:Uncharacterized protein n=1 Tax=Diatraea saccharalis TaxID=40085 RepID=A0A9N9RC96_9NEOP|nr:unnamed protein product [Diatraea saccharalis]